MVATELWGVDAPVVDTIYRAAACLDDGSVAILRAATPADKLLLATFDGLLLEKTIERRYFKHMKFDQRIAPERLTRECVLADNDILLVADRRNPDTLSHEIVGIGQLRKIPQVAEADMALVVASRWQHLHIGARLMRGLLRIAQRKGLNLVHVTLLADDTRMRGLCEFFGFTIAPASDSTIVASKQLLPLPDPQE
jgi:acetyltransferase